MRSGEEPATLVWYAAYGSNLRRERFSCYLSGGRPEGSARTYAGCRDPAPSRAEGSIRFPGRIAFGGESTVWTGGMAFVDPGGHGQVAARTYLITLEQFSDVVAQEIRQIPGRDIPVAVTRRGGRHGLGPGRYDTVLRVGVRDGLPVLAITAADLPEPAPPADAYLWSMAHGLHATFEFDQAAFADYLSPAPGIDGEWSRERLLALAGRASSARASC
jgi:hypothetical protein